MGKNNCTYAKPFGVREWGPLLTGAMWALVSEGLETKYPDATCVLVSVSPRGTARGSVSYFTALQ